MTRAGWDECESTAKDRRDPVRAVQEGLRFGSDSIPMSHQNAAGPLYQVVVNAEGQYSIWPANCEPPEMGPRACGRVQLHERAVRGKSDRGGSATAKGLSS